MWGKSSFTDTSTALAHIRSARSWLWLGCTAAGLCTAASAQAAAPVKCHSTATHTVIGRERPDDAGTDFIVRAKAHSAEKTPCAYRPAKTDFRIGGPDDAYFFLALKGSMLALDGGTGPVRDLVVFNLDTREKVLEAVTSGEDTKVTDQGIAFWMRTEDGTEANCSEFKEYSEAGLGAMIETRATFDFAAASLIKSTQTRCTATQ